MMAETRHLHLLGATGVVKTMMHEGREHLVVPVVALMEGVIHAVNAATPEFVSLATLQKAAASWAGKPVTLGHPKKNGAQCSANSPEVLASHGMGFVKNPRVEGKKMLCEAWIDTARAKMLHPDMYKRLLDGKQEEVSVGAYVVTDDKPGTHGNKPFMASWLETIGDHLAFLPGGRGACSIDMGCGAHRAATMRVMADRLEALGALPDKAQVMVQGGRMKVGDKVKVNKPGHAAHGKTGAITATSKGGSVHAVAGHGWFHKSNLKAAQGPDVPDTPEEAASEEAAELIAYQGLRTLMDGVGDQWDQASGLIDDLITDEEENPTETAAQEEAEEEVEAARLESVRALCQSMIGGLSGIISATYSSTLMPDPVQAIDPRYMAAKMIDCPTCNGSGQVKDGKQQADCPTCDGSGKMMRTAEVKALLGSRHSKSDMEIIQGVHDHAMALGATCDRANYKMLGDTEGHDFHGNQYRAKEGHGGTKTPQQGDRVKVMGQVFHAGKTGTISSSDSQGSFHYVKDGKGNSLGSFHSSDLKVLAAELHCACSGACTCDKELRAATIRNEGGKWTLYTKDGSKKLGQHNTEAEAIAQEGAIEAAKQRRASETSA